MCSVSRIVNNGERRNRFYKTGKQKANNHLIKKEATIMYPVRFMELLTRVL